MTNKERIATVAKLLKTVLQSPKSIFLILNDETSYKKQLLKAYGKSEFQAVDINYFITHETCEINNYAFLEGGSMITDLVLLKSLAATYDNCQYLEIGTWRGESIVNVADVENSHCTSINLSPEQIIAMGLPEKYAYEHGVLLKGRENVETIYANSQTFDFSSLNKKFNLIFVDGDHKYEAVKKDTESVFNLLKDKNSMIVWHDYGFDPVTPRHSVIKGILDGLPTEEHRYLYHVSNTMCAIYTRSEEIRKQLRDKSTLDKVFRVKIENSPFKS